MVLIEVVAYVHYKVAVAINILTTLLTNSPTLNTNNPDTPHQLQQQTIIELLI